MKTRPLFFLTVPGTLAVLAAASPAWAEEAENIGFPQLNPASYASQVFWLAVAFCALYLLMSRLALPRMDEVLKLRDSRKKDALNHAGQLNNEAGKVQKAYETALAKAHAAAQKELHAAEQGIKEKITAEDERFTEQARARSLAAEQNIAKARQAALQSLVDISAELAVDIAGKIGNIQSSKADARKITAALIQKD